MSFLARNPLITGGMKLALHAMSYSGLGYMSGGPIGGANQEAAKYRVDCRWNRHVKKAHVWRLHELMQRSRCDIWERDFELVLAGAQPTWVVYLDPPYYDKGSVLYRYAMSEEDHLRLARIVRELPCQWVLSYDDSPFIRQLYDGWTKVEELETTYTIGPRAQLKRPKNREILIRPC